MCARNLLPEARAYHVMPVLQVASDFGVRLVEIACWRDTARARETCSEPHLALKVCVRRSGSVRGERERLDGGWHLYQPGFRDVSTGQFVFNVYKRGVGKKVVPYEILKSWQI